MFQVLISTPAAAKRAKGDDKHRRMLILESFEPELLRAALSEHVASLGAHTWDEIVEKLRRNMYYEYEKNWS